MSSGPPDRYDNPAELSSVIDALSTAIVVLDAQLTIRHLNTAAESLLGVSNARAKGGNTTERFPGNDDYEAELRRVLADGNPSVRREMTLHIAPGETRIVDCRVSLMERAEGRELLVEMLDAEPRLHINREIALLAQQSVSRNISRQLAHEIKNPLSGLRGAAQLLQRELDSAELQEYTHVIISEADRLAKLVDSMLGPHQPVKKRAINVHQIVDRVHKLLIAEASPSINIIEDYDPSLPDLSLDADLITQALLNIGRNAIQILNAGGTLRLRTRAETQYQLRGKRHPLVARIDFEDDGPGVAEEVRETLFYPLITARTGGTGLGLALAQDLINRHEGLIQLRSASAPTIFSIYLPA
ncbi:MAG: nitrogen regulation protein NR(II) [Gammaproteobacteria bacterium]|nr:nitrogen regulation protein NR(II) [Gammaproteobacteria bacterium]MDH3766973.1 nitrogen regulation protein NR(II) [Gammaproteobacteria bacterium]